MSSAHLQARSSQRAPVHRVERAPSRRPEADATPRPTSSVDDLPASLTAPESQLQQLDGALTSLHHAVRAASPSGATAPVQLKASGSGPGAARDVTSVANAGLGGSASRLPHFERIQSAFGRHSVRDVRAHTDSAAAGASNALGALAFTRGDAVAFARAPDLHTAAHEAAHVVQQRAGVSLSGGMGRVGDAYEQHADRVADAVVRGQGAESLLDGFARAGSGSSASQSSAPIQRKERGGASAAPTQGRGKKKASPAKGRSKGRFKGRGKAPVAEAAPSGQAAEAAPGGQEERRDSVSEVTAVTVTESTGKINPEFYERRIKGMRAQLEKAFARMRAWAREHSNPLVRLLAPKAVEVAYEVSNVLFDGALGMFGLGVTLMVEAESAIEGLIALPGLIVDALRALMAMTDDEAYALLLRLGSALLSMPAKVEAAWTDFWQQWDEASPDQKAFVIGRLTAKAIVLLATLGVSGARGAAKEGAEAVAAAGKGAAKAGKGAAKAGKGAGAASAAADGSVIWHATPAEQELAREARALSAEAQKALRKEGLVPIDELRSGDTYTPTKTRGWVKPPGGKAPTGGSLNPGAQGPGTSRAALQGASTRTPEQQRAIAKIGKTISQRQNRHIQDTKQWGVKKGGYLKTLAEAQAVLDAVHSGEARVIGMSSEGHLIVEVKGVTGYNNARGAGFVDQPTNIFLIKGTAKPSVVPTSPARRGTE